MVFVYIGGTHCFGGVRGPFEDGLSACVDCGQVPATPGPMARRVEDLVEVCAAVWDTPYYDSDIRIPPLPFSREATQVRRPLRIGWYTHGYVYPEPCRSVVRAVEEARDALKAAGHTLLQVQPWEACPLADIVGCDVAMERLTDTDGGLVVGAVPQSSGSQDSHPDHWSHPSSKAHAEHCAA